MSRLIKRILAVLLVIAAAASLCACFGGKPSTDTDESQAPVSDTDGTYETEPAVPVSDTDGTEPAESPAPTANAGGTQQDPSAIPVKTAADLKKLTCGAVFTLGRYEQDCSEKNGPEAVEWIVVAIEDGRILAISRYALFAQTMNSKMWEGTTWEKCDLRKMLNTQFYGQTFNDEEKLLIAEAQTEEDAKGKPVKDKVFVLSREEFEKFIETDLSLVYCLPTEYALTTGAYHSEKGFTPWWLRTEYDRNDRMCVIGMNTGKIEPNYPFNGGGSVRPAIWLNCD